MRHPSFNTPTYKFVNYCEMSRQDSQIIFELRNNPFVSIWMVDDDYISLEQHSKFLASLTDRDDKDYFIIKNDSNEIIGSVNIDYCDMGISERGIYIDPERQGHGHAFKAIKEFYQHARNNWGIKAIKTKVKVDNVPSNALERKLGARLMVTSAGYNGYLLELR